MIRKYKIALLDLERFRQILTYDPGTGVFTWLKTLSPRGVKGTRAGALTKAGYRRIGIDGVQYFEHDLAWLFHYGEPPDRLVDHKNLIKSENYISNLRRATSAENARNQGLNPRNTTGFKGVKYQAGRYHASIRADKTNRIYLGSFATAEEAGAAYANKAQELHGEFARVI